MFNLLKSKKGFTLVELMVVVVILGILVAIAVPLFNSSSEDARETADAATARTLNGAISLYKANEAEADVDALEAMTTGAAVLDELIAEGYIQGPASNTNISRLTYVDGSDSFTP